MQRYQPDTVIKNEDNQRIFETSYHPEFPITDKDLFIITKRGQRFDELAYQYYQDQTLWWVIAKANGLVDGSLVIRPGIRIRIPDLETVDQIDLKIIEAQNRT